VRDLRGIKYDNRNFDDVVHAIVSAVSWRANPLDDVRTNVPKRLRNLVKSGTHFLDVPLPRSYEGDSTRPDHLYCELRMRETPQRFVFRAAKALEIGAAVTYLAHQTIRTLQGHSNGIKAVAVTPDGHRAVSGSDDKTLRLWDLETGQTIRTLQGHTNESKPWR
jgi:WD40 repeat protein